LSLTESLYTHDYRPGMFQSSVKWKIFTPPVLTYLHYCKPGLQTGHYISKNNSNWNIFFNLDIRAIW
jgi:hypothetical protein